MYPAAVTPQYEAWLIRETFAALMKAHRTATDFQKFSWTFDVRLHIDAVSVFPFQCDDEGTRLRVNYHVTRLYRATVLKWPPIVEGF